MKDHVKVVGILWICSGALFFLGAIVGFGVLYGISFIPDIGVESPIVLRTIATGIGIFFTIMAVPQVIGGIWLLKFKEWARILVLALSFLALLNFPLGTALGVYTLVILFNNEVIRLFKT